MPQLFNLASGLLVINKPKNWTSFDVVKKARNLLGAKKVGHTGTLDPQATGVLVLCVNRATKLVDKITVMDKEYIGEITFGATSNTDDAEGTITPNLEAGVKSEQEVRQALKRFEGEIDQVPPDFSAKQVEGQRAYDMARKGKPLELKSVRITFFELEVLAYKWPVLKVRVVCSKGAYLRSLARDLGAALGVGGYLTMLDRTRVGPYKLEQAITIDQVTPQTKLMEVRL